MYVEQTTLMCSKKRSYIAPLLNKHQSVEDLPEKLQKVAAEILESHPPLLTVVNDNRQYVEVSEEFARLLGYSASELIGKRVDDITVKSALDIELTFRMARRFGEIQGLWLFERRDGKPLLCSYYARKVSSKFKAELRPINLEDIPLPKAG